MSELSSTEVERPLNRREAVAQVLSEAMQPAQEEVSEETQVEAEAEAVEETEEIQASETEEAPIAEKQESSEEESVAIQTLPELAEAIEVDNDFLYGIKIPLADGEEPVTLSELKDAYRNREQTSSDAQAAIDQKQAEFDRQREEFQKGMTEQLATLQKIPEELMAAEADVRAIAKQYQTFDWAKLEEVDPGRAALEKQNLATQYSQAEAKAKEIRQQADNAQRQEFERVQSAQAQKILSAFPTWSEPAVAQKEFGEISGLLSEYKFNQQEIAALGDARTLKLLKDFMELKSRTATAEKTVKKVVKTPKTLRPGATKPAPSGNQKLQAQLDNAKATKDARVKVRAIGNLLSSVNGGTR